jgi:hypothetical protein
MVLLHIWRVNVKTIPGFINIPLADLSSINQRHNKVTSYTNSVDRPRQRFNYDTSMLNNLLTPAPPSLN